MSACMSGTRGSCVLSSTGEVCDMCMCLARGGVGGEGGEGLYQSYGVGHVSLFWLRWCRWGVGRGFGPGSGAVGWCYVCVKCEWILCVDGRSRYLCVVLCGYLHI